MGIFRALLNHLALLISLGLLQSLIVRLFPLPSRRREVFSGLLFGAIAMLGILFPVRVDGAIYDGRSIVLSLAGIFGGPWATLIAAGLASIARAAAGGAGIYVGIAVIAESALLGLAYRPLFLRGGAARGIPALWAFSLMVHGLMVLLQCALPADIRWHVVSQIWWPVLLLYPPVFVLLAVVFDREEERARVQDELDRQQQLMQQLLDTLPTPVTYRDAQGRYLLCNDAFCQYTGKSRDQIVGGTLRDLQLGDFSLEIERHDAELMQNPGTQKFELRIPCADGVTRDILFERSAVRGPQGDADGIVAVMSDISELRRMEGQLRHSQKLEAVGRLAGGVAHDFNNMLGVILAQVEEILDKTPADSPLISDLEEIRMAALRSTELTRQLLLFARRQEVQPKRINPVGVVRSSLQMLRRVIPENKSIALTAGEGVWPVFINESHYEQIVTNLVINASDAIAGNGSIRVTLENLTCPEARAGIPMTLIPGQWVRLAVEDDGCGIHPEDLDRIFDPFFTTKDTGKGTGLGLATVYGIVVQASGCIQVASTPGKGTLFEIYLRACLDEKADTNHNEKRTTDEVRSELAELSRNDGHFVLVVEDEDANLRIALRILSRAGVQVFGATSPSKAMEIFRAHTREIGILLTDVIMPEKNGVELWREMRELRPDLRCIFMSGYTADVISQEDLMTSGAFFLPKPFDRSALLHIVHHAMTLNASGKTAVSTHENE